MKKNRKHKFLYDSFCSCFEDKLKLIWFLEVQQNKLTCRCVLRSSHYLKKWQEQQLQPSLIMLKDGQLPNLESAIQKAEHQKEQITKRIYKYREEKVETKKLIFWFAILPMQRDHSWTWDQNYQIVSHTDQHQ